MLVSQFIVVWVVASADPEAKNKEIRVSGVRAVITRIDVRPGNMLLQRRMGRHILTGISDRGDRIWDILIDALPVPTCWILRRQAQNRMNTFQLVKNLLYYKVLWRRLTPNFVEIPAW